MVAKGEKHISRSGATYKRTKTVTLWESLDGCMLPFELIYTGKRKRSLPDFTFLDGFCSAFNQKHWSNESKTICLIEDLLVLYIKKVKEKKAFSQSQKSFLVWDAFKTQSTPKVMDALSSYGIGSVMVPKNMARLRQPLDLTTNASFRKYEKRAFSEFFASSITEALTNDPDRDVATIKDDLRLLTLKPRHTKVMTVCINILNPKRENRSSKQDVGQRVSQLF